MFGQISWTACFMKLLLYLAHSMTSLDLLAHVALGAMRSLPSYLYIGLASHLFTSNQMFVSLLGSIAMLSTCFYLTANGKLVILPRET
jgi:hypothetical protein